MERWRASLGQALYRELLNSEGQSDGSLDFSSPVPYGKLHTHLGTVMMTCIKDKDTVFVHASDIQLLSGGAVSLILD